VRARRGRRVELGLPVACVERRIRLCGSHFASSARFRRESAATTFVRSRHARLACSTGGPGRSRRRRPRCVELEPPPTATGLFWSRQHGCTDS
jgi:hypothetical protein